MSEYPLRDAIFDAEDNLRRTRDFAQVMVDQAERLAKGRDRHSRAFLRLAYEVLDCTDSTIEDWSKMFGLVTRSDKTGDRQPLKTVGDGGPRP